MSRSDIYRILIAEDEFLIAAELEQTLGSLGYQCVGPFPTVEKALAAVRAEPIDGAILNLILDNERADEVAQLLQDRNIPFAFASGLSAADHDPRWHKMPKLSKPYSMAEVESVLAAMFPKANGQPGALSEPSAEGALA